MQEINPSLDDLFHILNIKIVEKNQGVIECREVLTSNVENDFLEKLQKGEYLTVDQKLHYLKDPSLLKYDLYLQKEKILIDAKADQVSDFIENLLREYKKTI